MLPPTVFESALREAEERTPFIPVVDATGVQRGGETAFIATLRAECARRGWVQVDVSDPESWMFHDPAHR